MKQEVNPKVMAAVVAVVVLAILGIGWKMFAPHQASQEDFFAANPGAKAAQENMHKMSQSTHMEPPPNVHIRGNGAH